RAAQARAGPLRTRLLVLLEGLEVARQGVVAARRLLDTQRRRGVGRRQRDRRPVGRRRELRARHGTLDEAGQRRRGLLRAGGAREGIPLVVGRRGLRGVERLVVGAAQGGI